MKSKFSFIISTLFFALFFINLVYGKINQNLGGAGESFLGDVGEFICLCMVTLFFVIGVIILERSKSV